MKHLLILFVFVITMASTLNAQTEIGKPKGETKFPNGETYKNAGFTYTLIPAANKTWGYDIYKEKHLFIHQATIPGLPGNEGFKTKAAADTIARVVIRKIKRGEIPPSVTIEEMKKLKVL